MPLLTGVATTAATEVMLLLLLLLLGLPTSAAARQTCPQVRGFMAAGRRTVRLLVLVPHFLTLLRHLLLLMMSGTQIASLLCTNLLLLLLLFLRLTRLAPSALRFLLEEPLYQALTQLCFAAALLALSFLYCTTIAATGISNGGR